MYGSNKSLTAYEILLGLESSTGEQISKFRAEINETGNQIIELQAKVEEMVLLGQDPSEIESQIQLLRTKQLNLAKRINVLESAYASDIFIATVKKAIDENTEALRALNAEWTAMEKELDEAFEAYLKVVASMKPLVERDSQLHSQRSYCYAYMPKGTPIMYVVGVPAPVNLNRQEGAIFKCLDVGRIKQAYQP